MIRLLPFIVLFFFGSQLLLAQNEKLQLSIIISGENQQKMKGVTVKSSQNSAVTDENGIATLFLSEGKHSIKISHSNYQEKELDVNLNSSKTLNFQLQPIDKLEEIIIFSKEGKGLTTIDRKENGTLTTMKLHRSMEFLYRPFNATSTSK